MRDDLFECPICLTFYKEEKYALGCEKFCKEHRACNPEILKHAARRQ